MNEGLSAFDALAVLLLLTGWVLLLAPNLSVTTAAAIHPLLWLLLLFLPKLTHMRVAATVTIAAASFTVATATAFTTAYTTATVAPMPVIAVTMAATSAATTPKVALITLK